MSEQEWRNMANEPLPTDEQKSNSNKAALVIAAVLFAIGLTLAKTLGL